MKGFLTRTLTEVCVCVCGFSGQVGDWRNWFTAAENEEFDRRHRERMQQCGDLTVDFEL